MSEDPGPFAPPPTAPPAAPTAPPPGAAWGLPRFTAGTLLERAFTTWGRHLPSLLGIQALVLVPVFGLFFALAYMGLAGPGVSPAAGPGRTFLSLGVILAAVFLVVAPVSALGMGATTYGVVRWQAGLPASFGDMLAQAGRRFWPLLRATWVLAFALGIAFAMLCVPGLMFAAAAAVAMPAVAMEEIGAVDGLERSYELTRGHRWHVFAALALVWGVSFVVAIVITALGRSFGLTGTLLGELLRLFTGSLQFVILAVAYHDLRLAKEGAASPALAQVFE